MVGGLKSGMIENREGEKTGGIGEILVFPYGVWFRSEKVERKKTLLFCWEEK